MLPQTEMTSKREQWSAGKKDALDAACQTLIGLARQNPSGECFVLILAADVESGELFQIAVRKVGDK